MLFDNGAELGIAGERVKPGDTAQATVRYHLLVATGHKKDKETGANALRGQWAKARLHRELCEPAEALWQPIGRPEPDLTLLPACSFSLHFRFTLAQPYLSKDDNPFYIIDNPIARDKVFRLPLVRPSGWKGNLRLALRQLGHAESEPAWQRLFGKEPKAGDGAGGRAGRLTFYPSFFAQTGLEIINPHNRQTRVGEDPILFECVPEGAQGIFTLLYTPFDRIGQDGEETARQLANDLPLVAEGLQAMFCLYGFSAKRSSGYGLAQEGVSGGSLTVHLCRPSPAPGPAPASAPPTEPLPRYLADWHHLRPEYLNPDGTFRERSEAELQKLKRSDRQLYHKARAWWQRAQKAAAEGEGRPPEPAPSLPQPTPLWHEEFQSFSELVALASRVAGSLQRGGRP